MCLPNERFWYPKKSDIKNLTFYTLVGGFFGQVPYICALLFIDSGKLGLLL
jgi:hypothetical protein